MRHATIGGMLLAIVCAGCFALPSGHRCQSGEQPATMDSLYFGTALAQGRVTPQDWERFVADVVTPRFPEGLTSWAAAGQWRNAAGTIQKESSYVLHIVHSESRDENGRIREVIDLYKVRFHQEAVLRVRSAACISF